MYGVRSDDSAWIKFVTFFHNTTAETQIKIGSSKENVQVKIDARTSSCFQDTSPSSLFLRVLSRVLSTAASKADLKYFKRTLSFEKLGQRTYLILMPLLKPSINERNQLRIIDLKPAQMMKIVMRNNRLRLIW